MLSRGVESCLKIPDFEEARRNLGIKNTLKYRKSKMGKFWSIIEVFDGFIFDDVIENYKQVELLLIH